MSASRPAGWRQRPGDKAATYDYRQARALHRIGRRIAATRLAAHMYPYVQMRVDRAVFRLSGGRTTLTSWVGGMPVVMLTTSGARTAQPRTLPLLGLFDGERVILIASNYGRPRHPAWYHNLRAHPRASIRVKGRAREVEARELSGEERDHFYRRAVAMYPGFAHYRVWAGARRIPVVELLPV
jgi:deazaflavin-dependent oxidoreductase (nitroreductase family)